jgi:hypothetical protein
VSLDLTKLQKVRELGGGGVQAQCPACAEAGQDRKGEHLRISPEGKFGCCVFPGDREHRSRIFALAGEHGPKAIKVRLAAAKTAEAVQLDLLGRLGRVFGTPEKPEEIALGNLGTPGTGDRKSYAYREGTVSDHFIYKLIGSERPVPSVPKVEVCEELETGVPGVPGGKRLPYLSASGDLVIPFDSPERYHWWTGGQSPRETRRELMERKESDASPF